MHSKNFLLEKRIQTKNLTQKLQVSFLQNNIAQIPNKNLYALETGCGYGFFTKSALPYCTKIIATDFYDCFSDKLKTNSKIKYYNNCDANNLPFENNNFDLVFNMDLIEHIENDKKFIKEAFRVTKKGGHIIIGTPNRNRFSQILLKLIGKPVKFPHQLSNDPYYGPVIHIREYTKIDFLKLLNKCNVDYEIVNINYLSFGILNYFEINCPKMLNSMAQFLLFHLIKK